MISLPAARVSARADAFGFLDSVLSFSERSHGRACALLLALCLACFLPGLASLQPMDRDEPRFAQASKQMLETGDLVDIRFQGEARHKKPVGIYWAQSAVVAAAEALGVPQARTRIALYRIPSLIGALGAALLTYWAALAFLPRRGAVLAAALFAACLMLSAEARLAKTDALLAACAVAALGGLARAWTLRGTGRLDWATVLVFWLAMAAGILVKGPMVPLFAGLAALALSLRERSGAWLLSLRPGLGLALALVLVAPWFVAIAWKSGGAFLGEAVGNDMLAKVGSAKERHGAPPGSYLVVFFATFWPGAAFAALSAPFAWANRRDDAVAFLLAWIVPAWILLEAVPTKLPHYVLPLMPAVAILTVMALVSGRNAEIASTRRGSPLPGGEGQGEGRELSGWGTPLTPTLSPWERGSRGSHATLDAIAGKPGARLVIGLVPVIPVGITLGLIFAAWHFDRVIPWAGLPLLLAACAAAILAWLAFARGTVERALLLAILASALLSPAVFGLTQPALAALKVSPRLAAIRDGLACADPRTASLGYREPSLVFLVGTDLVMLNSGSEALEFLKAGGCRLVFVDARFAPEFDAAARAAGAGAAGGGAAGAGAAVVGQVSGFNINTGRRVDLSAYAVSP